MNILDTADNQEHDEIHNPMQTGQPHEALFLALAYLPLFELLSIGEACRSLRDAVNNDILPWLHIIVKRPLNSRLSNDILMKIASKANGRLQTLALINCVKITDDGLQQIIKKNPLITKLHVPACTGLTPEGVVRAVKTLTKHNHSLISVKINGIYNIKKEHLKTLCSILGTNLSSLNREYKQFRTLKQEETNRPIDIDICPRCNQVRMVFDCPREKCARKAQQKRLSQCRGCYYCIPRCVECGQCVEMEELGETACADTLCLECWLQLPKCNFCNRPYCKQHIDQQCRLSGSSGFICDDCHVKFFQSSYD